MSPLIAPSLLSANFADLQSDIEMINRSKADWLHLDIMDGVFVPNISFGFPIIEAIAPLCKKPLDVHLMITQPEKFISRLQSLGTYMMNVHYEACLHLHRTVQEIKKAGMKAGITLNAHTLIEVDGGINIETARLTIDAGADILVCGHSVFSSGNPEATIAQMKAM